MSMAAMARQGGAPGLHQASKAIVVQDVATGWHVQLLSAGVQKLQADWAVSTYSSSQRQLQMRTAIIASYGRTHCVFHTLHTRKHNCEVGMALGKASYA